MFAWLAEVAEVVVVTLVLGVVEAVLLALTLKHQLQVFLQHIPILLARVVLVEQQIQVVLVEALLHLVVA
jgi:hypothetical protein